MDSVTGTDKNSLRRGKFPVFAAAYGASFLGDQMWFITLGWAAGQLDSAGETALVMAVGSVPRAVLLLVGGAVADRFGPRRTSVRSQVLRFVLLLAGALALLGANGTNLRILVAIALMFGAIDAIHTPALGAITPSLLSRERLAAGQGILQGIQRVSMVLGAPLGGLAVALGSVSAALVLIAVLFAVSWIGLRSLGAESEVSSATTKGRGSFVRDAISGLRSAATEPIVLAILIVMTVLNFGLSGQLNVGVVLLSRESGWGATGFGALLSAFAVGAAVGAFATAGLPSARRPLAAALLWVAGGTACLASLPLAPSLLSACALIACAGVAFGPASALLMGTLQAKTEPSNMGKITALTTFASVGLTPIAYVAFGALADTTSTAFSFAFFGAAVITTCVVALCIKAVRIASLSQ